jgi:hypothetical protein
MPQLVIDNHEAVYPTELITTGGIMAVGLLQKKEFCLFALIAGITNQVTF